MYAPLPIADKPVSVDLYKDGMNEGDIITFKLITLKSKAHYPFWYWNLIKEIRLKYWLQVAVYFNAYVSQETEAMDKALEQIPEEKKVELKPDLDLLCRRVFQELVRVRRPKSMKGDWGLDDFVHFHADMCKMNLVDHIKYLRTWSVVCKPCQFKDYGIRVELKAMLYDIPYDEHVLLGLMNFSEVQDFVELVRAHWRQFKVDQVDIRKRLFLANQSPALRCVNYKRLIGVQALGNSRPAISSDRTPANTNNVSGLCEYCGLPNHPSDRCFKNNPELLEAFRKARKERKKKIKAAKKLRMSNGQPSSPPPTPIPEATLVKSELALSDPIRFVWGTGSAISFVNDIGLLKNFQQCPRVVGGIGPRSYTSPGYGTVTARTISGNAITLEKVYFMEGASSNLITASQGFGLEIVKTENTLYYKGVEVGGLDLYGYFVIELVCDRHDSTDVMNSLPELTNTGAGTTDCYTKPTYGNIFFHTT